MLVEYLIVLSSIHPADSERYINCRSWRRFKRLVSGRLIFKERTSLAALQEKGMN